MKDVPVKREYIKTEYGYKVVHDYGPQGCCTDHVYVPPYDPEAAAKTRREINAVLAQYGYRLAEKEEVKQVDREKIAPR